MVPVNPTDAEREALVLKALIDLEAVLMPPKLTEAEKHVRYRQYLDALSPYTVHEVQTGIVGCLRIIVDGYYPAPGQIIANIPRYEAPRSDEEFRNRIQVWLGTRAKYPDATPEQCWPAKWGGTGPGTDPRHPQAVLAEFRLDAGAPTILSPHAKKDASGRLLSGPNGRLNVA